MTVAEYTARSIAFTIIDGEYVETPDCEELRKDIAETSTCYENGDSIVSDREIVGLCVLFMNAFCVGFYEGADITGVNAEKLRKMEIAADLHNSIYVDETLEGEMKFSILPECDVEAAIKMFNEDMNAEKYDKERNDAEGKAENLKSNVVYYAARNGLTQGAYIGIQFANALRGQKQK